MSADEIKNGLIAFKGNTFFYARADHKTAEPVYFCVTLSSKEMQFVDRNPAILAVQE